MWYTYTREDTVTRWGEYLIGDAICETRGAKIWSDEEDMLYGENIGGIWDGGAKPWVDMYTHPESQEKKGVRRRDNYDPRGTRSSHNPTLAYVVGPDSVICAMWWRVVDPSGQMT